MYREAKASGCQHFKDRCKPRPEIYVGKREDVVYTGARWPNNSNSGRKGPENIFTIM
jgi:hypothetical protein